MNDFGDFYFHQYYEQKFNNEWSAFKSEEIKFIENDNTVKLNQQSALDNSFDLFSDTESSEFSVFSKKYVGKLKTYKMFCCSVVLFFCRVNYIKLKIVDFSTSYVSRKA